MSKKDSKGYKFGDVSKGAINFIGSKVAKAPKTKQKSPKKKNRHKTAAAASAGPAAPPDSSRATDGDGQSNARSDGGAGLTAAVSTPATPPAPPRPSKAKIQASLS